MSFTDEHVQQSCRCGAGCSAERLVAVSLAIVPVLYIVGARTAKDVPLPPEAQAVAGAGA